MGIWRLVFIENTLTPTSIWLLILTIQSVIKIRNENLVYPRAECLPSSSDSKAFERKYGIA